MTQKELCNWISEQIQNTKCSSDECAKGIKDFDKILNRYNTLSKEKKEQFWIESFSNPEAKEECKEFALRHPNCRFNKFIPD